MPPEPNGVCVIDCLIINPISAAQVTACPYRPIKKPRKHFEGATTAGTVIGHVGVPKAEDHWLLTFGDKKGLYGNLRQPVGGKVEGADANHKRKRNDMDFEPSSYWGMLPIISEEILHGYPSKAVIDCTPVTAELALSCIHAGIPYLGICYTEQHMELLRLHA